MKTTNTTLSLRAWHADGPHAAYLPEVNVTHDSMFEIPRWASHLSYSPRAKLYHRTLEKRILLESLTGLPTHLVVIEVGPKAYVSKLSLEAIRKHVCPLANARFSTKALISALVDNSIRHTIEVGKVLSAHGMH